MGKPLWLLLPAISDWRWLLKRADSPWYPSARLFWQPRTGDWATVISQVAAELAASNDIQRRREIVDTPTISQVATAA